MYPLSNFTVFAAPAEEPITVEEAKLHLRIDYPDDDTLVGALVTAATEHVERMTSRALVTRTLDYYIGQFPGIPPWKRSEVIELPQPPLIEVDTLEFTDTVGAVRAWTPSGTDLLNELGVLNAHVDNVNQPGRIVLSYNAIWPNQVLKTANAVKIRYTCGYGAASDVPVAAKQAMLMLIGTWYANRESVSAGTLLEALPIPHGVDMLLAPLKNWNFA